MHHRIGHDKWALGGSIEKTSRDALVVCEFVCMYIHSFMCVCAHLFASLAAAKVMKYLETGPSVPSCYLVR